MQRILVFLACFFIYANCFGQRYAFVNYTPKDGLVNNRARFIFQDNKGKIYISTFGGLSVYDGSRFTNYTPENGLASSLINDIVEMGDDSLWIVPNTNQLQYMVHGEVKNYQTADNFCPVINQLIKCSDGFYYAISDGGLFRFEKNIFTKISLTDKSEKKQIINLYHAVEVDHRLYIYTDPNNNYFPGRGTLIVYDIKTGGTNISFNQSPIYSITSTPNNDVLISTQSGFFKIDKAAMESGKILLTNASAQYHIPESFGPAFVFFDNEKNEWLLGLGVLKIDVKGKSTLFDLQNGLPENEQEFFFQDKENIIWLAGAHSGICKMVNQQLESFTEWRPGFHESFLSADNSSDSLWFYDATRNTILLRYDNADEIFAGRDHPSFHNLYSFSRSVYLVNEFEVYKVNFKSKEHSFSTSLLYKDSSGKNGFSCLVADNEGNLVAVSDKAVAILQNGKTVTSELGYLADQACIAGNYLWIANRAKKLFLYKINPGDTGHYMQLLHVFSKALQNVSPRSIAADKNGNVWVGTRDHGLVCYSYQNDSLEFKKQLTIKNGLSENFISYLHCDDANNIWVCSPAGLDKIVEKNNEYYVDNITRSNNIFQQVSKINTQKNGTHWIQTADAAIRLGKELYTNNQFSPQLLFSQIKIGDSILFNTQKTVELNYTQNNISVLVSAPTFYDEKQTRFSYLLEGSNNKTWSEPSSQSEIDLVNLEPGKYSLKIKAIFLNGFYPPQMAVFSFSILPPWWQSWWFRILVLLAVLVIIIVVTISYYSRKLEKQRIALEKQQAIEKERTRIATDMHDDLGAGLSRIKFLSETIGIKEQQERPIDEDIFKIKEYAAEMIDKMGEIVWALNEKNDSLSDLLAYTRSYAVEYLLQNGITGKIAAPENFPVLFVSGEFRRNIYLVVKEALHNVVKHAQATEVNMTINISDSLVIILHDNGTGFDPNKTRAFSNGITNMQKRMSDIGGTLEIKNENGTRIELCARLLQ